MRSRYCLLFAFGWISACSSDPGVADANLDASFADAAQRDADPCQGPDSDSDGVADSCDPCPATPSGPGLPVAQCYSILEQEPNDAPDSGLSIAAPEVGSAIELVGSIQQNDQDRFRLEVGALTKMRITLRRRGDSDLEPKLVVSGGSYSIPRELEGGANASRELLFVVPGTYDLIVSDGVNLGTGDYSLSIQPISWQADSNQFSEIVPGPQILEIELSDRQVPVYTSKEAIIRVPQATQNQDRVQPILVSYRLSEQPYEYFETETERFRLRDVYWAIDHRKVAGTERTVELEVTGPTEHPEAEPNDSAENATIIPWLANVGYQAAGGTMPMETAPELDWFSSHLPRDMVVLWHFSGARDLNPLDSPGTDKSLPRFVVGKLKGGSLTSSITIEPPARASDEELLWPEIGDGDATTIRVTETRNDAPPYVYWSEFADPDTKIIRPHYILGYQVLGTLAAPVQTIRNGDFVRIRFNAKRQVYGYTVQIDKPARLCGSERRETPDLGITFWIYDHRRRALFSNENNRFVEGDQLTLLHFAQGVDTSTRTYSFEKQFCLEED